MQMEQTGLTGAAATWFFHEVAKVVSDAKPSDQVAMVERYRVLEGEVTFFVGGEAGWPSPDEEAAVTAIARANGIELLGPPGALPSLG